MGILYAFLAVIGDSLTTAIDRLNFKRNRIATRQLMLLVFSTISVLLLLFIIATNQPFPHFTIVSFGLMVLIAVVSLGGNMFDYLSLKADDLSLREPLSDFEPIIAGLFGYLFFPAERKPGFLFAFLASTVIVYWGTHRRKLRKVQKKGMLFMLLAICLGGLLPSIYKLALDYLSPAYITLFRATAILVLIAVFFPKKKVRKLNTKKIRYGIASGAVCSVGAVAGLYAIHSLGVVLAMLLMMLGPLIRYSAGYFVLKEDVRKGEVISSFLLAMVIVTSVIS